MKPKKLLVFAFWLAAAAAVAAVATLPAAAQDRQLSGIYFSTGEVSCFVSSTGFNPNLTPAAGATVYFQTSSAQATLQFNTDGTGTVIDGGDLFITFPPATVLGASATEYAPFSFTYTALANGALTLVFGPTTGTFIAGPFTGAPFSIALPPLSGRIASNGTITLTSTVPTVETLDIFFPAPIGTHSIIRICKRTRVLVPIPKL